MVVSEHLHCSASIFKTLDDLKSRMKKAKRVLFFLDKIIIRVHFIHCSVSVFTTMKHKNRYCSIESNTILFHLWSVSMKVTFLLLSLLCAVTPAFDEPKPITLTFQNRNQIIIGRVYNSVHSWCWIKSFNMVNQHLVEIIILCNKSQSAH